MLTVSISINGTVIFARSCRNLGKKGLDGKTIYTVDDGSTIEHDDDGAITLAHKLLDRIHEV